MRHEERLELAPFAFTDADELFLIRGDAEAMRHWDWPADATCEDTHVLARLMLDDIAAGYARVWTVRRGRDGAFVGLVDLSAIDGGQADLGFMIRRDFWGHGYAFGAATLAILNARAMNLSRLRARIHAGNLRSQRLLERLGFSFCEDRPFEVRPGVTKLCRFFALGKI